MRIKDLRSQDCLIWPHEWAGRLEGTDEDWILIEVNLHTDNAQPYIYFEAVRNSHSEGGVVTLGNLEHLKILYQVLHSNLGKNLREIGDIKITF